MKSFEVYEVEVEWENQDYELPQRVTYGTYTTRETAQSKLEQILRFPNAEMFIKKYGVRTIVVREELEKM